VEIGQVIEEIQRATTTNERLQLEKILASLERLYEEQCGGKRPARAERSGVHASIVDSSVLLNLEDDHGNGVRVIIGGNDGVLITIDGQGHIHVLPPEGPGDPEIRQAISQIVKGIQMLSGRVAAGTAH
jgi:hypothetical protein